jgi:AraC-like DNA-binding protein
MTATPAPIRITTAAFTPRERVSVWREMFGRTIAKLDFEPLAPSFAAQATLRALPGMGLVTMASRELRFHKLKNLIDNDDVVLAIVETGFWDGEQFGRSARLGPGEAVLCSNAEVAVGVASGARTAIRLPRAALAPLVGDVEAAVLRPIPAEHDALRLLRGYLSTVNRIGMSGPAALQQLAVAHVRDLVALALGATRDAAQAAEAGAGRAARLAAIKRDIAENLADGDISVGALALRHQVTPRYIQSLFEHDGTTPTAYVLARRLELAHAQLADPRRREEKIAALAFDCGFGDLSYFNRVFRRRYGVAPSDVRAQACVLN